MSAAVMDSKSGHTSAALQASPGVVVKGLCSVEKEKDLLLQSLPGV